MTVNGGAMVALWLVLPPHSKKAVGLIQAWDLFVCRLHVIAMSAGLSLGSSAFSNSPKTCL